MPPESVVWQDFQELNWDDVPRDPPEPAGGEDVEPHTYPRKGVYTVRDESDKRIWIATTTPQSVDR